MRIMAIDYGDARTGLAFSDLTATLAGEAFTINEWNTQRLVEKIAAEAKSRDVGKIVIGNPLNMDGTAGPRAEKSAELAEMLRTATGLEVIPWDERRTTVDAVRILSENNRFGKKRKGKIDAVAAALILEAYLGSIR